MTDTNLHPEPNPPPEETTSSAQATTTTTPTGTGTPPPPPLPTETRPKDPRIAPLHALFPDYDDLILYSVLDSVNGDQDRAIDALLGMSDPEYISEPIGPAEALPMDGEPGLTQTELDEQFARRLLIEEQDAQQAAWMAEQEARRPQFAQRNQQRLQQPQQSPQQQQGQGQGDTMAEIQQQIGKFAETGKKTFNTFFNKVKAKIQEMDQPKTAQSSTYDPAQYEQRTYQDQAHPHVPYAARRAQAPAPQPAYYDPNPNERTASASASPPQAQGYDVAPVLKSDAGPATTPPLVTDAPGSTTPPLINLSNDTHPRTITSPPIDGGKYGLLPKRPVTLLRQGEPTQLQRQHSMDDSDDGLEYAESPFEEGKK